MKALQAVVLTLASAGLFLSAGAQASNNLLGQLQQAASDGLNGSSKSGSTGTTSSLTSLLSGGDSALTSTSASNAAGV